VVSVCVLLFFAQIGFVFWLAALNHRKKVEPYGEVDEGDGGDGDEGTALATPEVAP